MSTVIEQPRDDVPIVTDATLLAVPNMQDPEARTEYLKKVRALRNSEQAVAPVAAPAPVAQAAEPDQQPAEELDAADENDPEDAIYDPDPSTGDTPDERIRLSADDLKNYEIPVQREDGTIEYLSYEEFNKTVGTYSKQNKKSRDLAEREREVEALRTQLVERSQNVVTATIDEEAKLQQRYTWVTSSIAHAAKSNQDVVKFEDGSSRSLQQLLAEKTALESRYTVLQTQRASAEQELADARERFLAEQNEVLERKAPKLKSGRTDVSKYLERQGFTSEQANALTHGKAELLVLLDKAMRYDNATKSQNKEKRVGQNTRILGQRSRLEGRGVTVGSPQVTRIQELERLGTKANREQLKELYRLKQGR